VTFIGHVASGGQIVRPSCLIN